MKDELKAKVEELLEAGSCCAPLREKAEKFLAAEGTDGEAGAESAFMEELKKDVNKIEDSLAFFKSPAAKQAIGDKVDGMIKAFEEALDKGEDTCLCPACQAGKKILAMFDNE